MKRNISFDSILRLNMTIALILSAIILGLISTPSYSKNIFELDLEKFMVGKWVFGPKDQLQSFEIFEDKTLLYSDHKTHKTMPGTWEYKNYKIHLIVNVGNKKVPLTGELLKGVLLLKYNSEGRNFKAYKTKEHNYEAKNRNKKVKNLYNSIRNKISYNGIRWDNVPVKYELLKNDNMCIFIYETSDLDNKSKSKSSINLKHLNSSSIKITGPTKNAYYIRVSSIGNQALIDINIVEGSEIKNYKFDSISYSSNSAENANKVAIELASAINICRK